MSLVVSEADVEHILIKHLIKQNLPYKRQEPCKIGVIDVIFETSSKTQYIVEVKFELTREKIFQAIGQVLLYRAAYNPAAEVAITGLWHPDLEKYASYINELDILIMVCTEENQQI